MPFLVLVGESIKLLRKVLEDGKANKEYINSQQHEFLKVASKAVRRTLSYIRDENKRDTKTEEELSELWAEVALAVRPFDSDLAERCYLKGNYWANPDKWSDEEVEKARIEIERIDTEIRNHFKGKARAKKSKQQKAIEKTERGTEEPKKKFSRKKIAAIVASSILVLAALTTLILNLDKIKEMVTGKPAERRAKHTATQQKVTDSSESTSIRSEVKTSGDSSPAIVTSGPNSPVTVNYDSQEPKTAESNLALSPKEIYEDIESRPVFQQEDATKYYVGLKVKWRLYPSSISMLDEKTAWVIMRTPETIGMISCFVEISRYPQLKLAKEGSVIWVSGEIENVDKSLHIGLSNVSLEFE